MTKKFIGLQYPLVKTPRGTLAQKNGVDQIKADLLQLLLTNPGERIMIPEFGTPLRRLFFEPNDLALREEAREMIAASITAWEPRIIVNAIQITSSFDNDNLNISDTQDDIEHILGIKIDIIDPANISEIEELVIELPIGGV